MHYFSRLENTVKANWDGIALANFRGESFTYGDLAKQIARFHVFFETVGLQKGDKVALCAKNSARWGVTFFAAKSNLVALLEADCLKEYVESCYLLCKIAICETLAAEVCESDSVPVCFDCVLQS